MTVVPPCVLLRHLFLPFPVPSRGRPTDRKSPACLTGRRPGRAHRQRQGFRYRRTTTTPSPSNSAIHEGIQQIKEAIQTSCPGTDSADAGAPDSKLVRQYVPGYPGSKQSAVVEAFVSCLWQDEYCANPDFGREGALQPVSGRPGVLLLLLGLQVPFRAMENG